MKTIKVTPINLKSGAKAPYFIIEASDKQAAINEAKQNTRLSDFNNWDFDAEILKHL